jgi:hypothetical protein
MEFVCCAPSATVATFCCGVIASVVVVSPARETEPVEFAIASRSVTVVFVILPNPAAERIFGSSDLTKTTIGRGRGAAAGGVVLLEGRIVDRVSGLGVLASDRTGLVHLSCEERNHLPCGPSKLVTRGNGVRTLTTVGRGRDAAGPNTATRDRG